MRAFYDIDAYMIKKVDQSILMILFGFTFLSFLGHILFAFRYRYTWHRISIFVNNHRHSSFDQNLLYLDRLFMCHIRLCSFSHINSRCGKKKIVRRNDFRLVEFVKCWEDKLRKRLTNIYLSNEYIQTPNGFVKPNTGSAAAAAVRKICSRGIFIEGFYLI